MCKLKLKMSHVEIIEMFSSEWMGLRGWQHIQIEKRARIQVSSSLEAVLMAVLPKESA
jgi:hypothetical protein